jgi:protein-S-isoprenylcysteine O-methyltransferase Ste14
MLRWALKQLIHPVLLGLALFGGAGTLNWPAAWLFFGLSVACQLVNGAIMVAKDPELLVERGQAVAGFKAWDLPLALALAYGPLLAILAVSLEQRHGGLPDGVMWQQASAVVLMASGAGLTLWAMLANRYFSGLVRIQTERGHQVISTGPYASIRHPGYLGAIAYILGTPIYFGSGWALVIVLAITASTVVRTAREDITLQDELPGYAEYARRVRYRLLPGLW